MWQSADPILDQYLPNRVATEHQLDSGRPEKELKGAGGAFTPINLAMYSYVHSRPLNAIDPAGTDTIGVGVTLNAPQWLGKKIFGEDFTGQGVAAGVAISYYGLLGGQLDAGIYVEAQGGGQNIGTGKGTLDVTLNSGSVSDLGGQGATMSFNDLIGGVSLSVDGEGNPTGVGLHAGPGLHVSGAGTVGTTYTVRDAIQAVIDWLDE